jgi:hypothetical protein
MLLAIKMIEQAFRTYPSAALPLELLGSGMSLPRSE